MKTELLSKAYLRIMSAYLEFDAINDNVQEVIDYYGHNSCKISCDMYIDDKAFLPNDVGVVLTK